jgi:putative phosphoribosyl transferase
MRYRDRQEAGRELAIALQPYADKDPIVLALPRGGVVVGAEVARVLGAPLDVLVARKIGVPFQPELGMGAIAEGGGEYLDRETVELAGVSAHDIEEVVRRESAELRRRIQRYRGGRPLTDCGGRTVILVDDGIATGGTVRAALDAIRRQSPRYVILAAPVASAEAVALFRSLVDQVVCPLIPSHLFAIGAWYDDFSQVSDDEVVALLAGSGREKHSGGADGNSDDEIRIGVGSESLQGKLTIPANAVGLVLFAHGSGSSHRSPRNQFVAEQLNKAGVATLLFDLLTANEEREDQITGQYRFDIGLLTRRLVSATDWARGQSRTSKLTLGYFGASTGTAAALMAAAIRPEVVAIVSRGGRPDLAGSLRRVRSPTLLIVGGDDDEVIDMNRVALEQLQCEKKLVIVPGATHLFEEPGKLEKVAGLATEWFVEHFTQSARSARSTRDARAG